MENNIESRGERLKKRRLEKGLSLQEVYKKTKIHPKILEDLEQDNTLNINPVYLRGFLKMYCQFLGVEPQDYIKDIKTSPLEYTPKPKETITTTTKSSLRLSISKPHPNIIKAIIIVVISIAVLFILFRLSRNLHVKGKPAKEKKPAQRVIIKPENRPENQRSAISSEIRLGIHARDDCWLKIKVDGKTVFERTLKKGQSESWQAKEKIELQIGNAAAIDLDVNGKILSPLGKKGKSVKRAVITKEGFEALK